MKKSELTAKQAARILQVGLSHVYHLLWAGKLPASRKDGRWLIPAAAIEARRKAKV